MVGTIGQYIRSLRNEKGWTLSQLASMLNIDLANLSKIENGKRELDEKKLNKLCKIFKLDKSEMQKELVSEKIAREICNNELDAACAATATSVLATITQRPLVLTKTSACSLQIRASVRMLPSCSINSAAMPAPPSTNAYSSPRYRYAPA